jgi:hypothetical protein
MAIKMDDFLAGLPEQERREIAARTAELVAEVKVRPAHPFPPNNNAPSPTENGPQ